MKCVYCHKKIDNNKPINHQTILKVDQFPNFSEEYNCCSQKCKDASVRFLLYYHRFQYLFIVLTLSSLATLVLGVTVKSLYSLAVLSLMVFGVSLLIFPFGKIPSIFQLGIRNSIFLGRIAGICFSGFGFFLLFFKIF